MLKRTTSLLRSRLLLPVAVFTALFVYAAPALALPSSFGTEGSGAGQISGEPRGIAVDQQSGDVYVTDRNNNRIDKFGPEGEFLTAWGWGVADGTTEALQTCTTTCFGGTGSPFEGAGAGQFREAEGIAVDNSLGLSQGDVYVLEAGNSRIQKFGPEGEFILMFGGDVNATTKGDVCLAGETCKVGVPGEGPGELERLQGRSIAVDSTGTVYVGDEGHAGEGRVQLFNQDGGLQSEIALAGAGAVENLALDAAGDIYLKSTALEGVRKYDATGTKLGSPRDEAGQQEAKALTIGPADELLVNHFQEGLHHVFGYNAGGEQIASFDAGTEAQDAGKHGIAYGGKLKALYLANAGTIRIVTLPPPGPFVLLGSENASDIQPSTATLDAAINPEGPAATTYHFQYGTTVAYGESTLETPLKGGEFEDAPASAAITVLQPDTVYHFRVVATNGTQTTDGEDETFTTLPPVTIDSTSASEVNDSSARLQAELNPHGLPSEYRFEYDTTPYGEGEAEHGTKIPIPDASAGASTTDATVSNLIQGLTPSTTYYYRVIARNALNAPGEYVLGPDRSFTTQGAAVGPGVGGLPDHRQWELVSPPNKHGSPLEPITEEGGLIQAAADGGSFAYVALGPITGEPNGVRSPDDSQLLSVRGGEGWSTQDITTPHEEISKIHVGVPSEYKFFSEDLRAAIVEPEGATPLAPDNPANTERTPYQREANGEYVPLITTANVPAGTEFGGEESETTFGKSGEWGGGVEFVVASPDLSRTVLQSPQVLAPGFAPGFVSEGRSNLYELSDGTLRLISVLPSGEPLAEAGLVSVVGRNNLNTRGAISNDGERVVFSTVGVETQLYLRDIGLGQTVRLDERQPGSAGGEGAPAFQGANSDGSKVFFTDAARLTADATALPSKPDLYMCAIVVSAGHLTCALSDLSIDHNISEAANVEGEVAAIDATGTHVYFAADGVLTNVANARGEHAVPGDCNSEEVATCNLYEYDTVARTISLVAVVSSADDPDWAGRTDLRGFGNLTSRTSPDGRYLAFMSSRGLTGYDNRDAVSGQLDAEVFLFDSGSGTVRCVSCDPTGARPQGVFDKHQFPGLLVDHPASWRERWLAASIPGWTLGPSMAQSLHQSRYLSNSGRMFFNAADGLVPQDKNNAEDVYEYELPQGEGQPVSDSCTSTSATYSSASGGCVSLISSGTSKEESAFLDATENGDEVFFLTSARLTSSDTDAAFDVYDAHACSAESPCPPPPPPPPPACQGDACQNPVGSPSFPTPSSLTAHGAGNLVSAPPKAVVKSLTRAQKLAAALKNCKKVKGNSKRAKARRAKCEKSARGRYGPMKKKAAKKKR